MGLGVLSHAKRNPFSLLVDTDDAYHDMLLHSYHGRRVFDVVVGELRYMYETFDVDADIYKGSEVCDVRHDRNVGSPTSSFT